MQIAIDGPASAGKSTIAKIVATKLKAIYCDTGAMYRSVTVLALEKKLDLSDEAGILKALAQTKISFKPDQAGQRVFLGEEEVTQRIREPEITNNVSQVSALPGIRQEMVEQQRKIAESGDIVMDGRDIGTTVLPHATVKIFMVASASERAARRYKENIQKGIMTPLKQLEEEIVLRDQKDSQRAVSPLKKAVDATEIDTTSLTIDEVVERILKIVTEKTE